MNYENAVWIDDLIEYEGPFVILWKIDGKLYLELWADLDRETAENTWYVFEISVELLGALINGRASLLETLEKSPDIYRHVTTKPGKKPELNPIKLEDIPLMHKPTDQSFYEAEYWSKPRDSDQCSPGEHYWGNYMWPLYSEGQECGGSVRCLQCGALAIDVSIEIGE